MDKSFRIPHCAGEFSQREALQLTQRLVSLALLRQQLQVIRFSLNQQDPNYQKQKDLIEGCVDLTSEQMSMQLLHFSRQGD